MFKIDFPRRFGMRDYRINQGTLLIRSTMESHRSSGKRIDLVFKDTIRIDIPSYFDCNTVTEIHNDKSDHKIYEFYNNGNLLGKVCAGVLHIEESQKKYNEKSVYLQE